MAMMGTDAASGQGKAQKATVKHIMRLSLTLTSQSHLHIFESSKFNLTLLFARFSFYGKIKHTFIIAAKSINRGE